jgi:hypothetical protein
MTAAGIGRPLRPQHIHHAPRHACGVNKRGDKPMLPAQARDEKPTQSARFPDIEATQDREEELRRSMALIAADPELSRRLEMVQKAMTRIFGYTIDYT